MSPSCRSTATKISCSTDLPSLPDSEPDPGSRSPTLPLRSTALPAPPVPASPSLSLSPRAAAKRLGPCVDHPPMRPRTDATGFRPWSQPRQRLSPPPRFSLSSSDATAHRWPRPWVGGRYPLRFPTRCARLSPPLLMWLSAGGSRPCRGRRRGRRMASWPLVLIFEFHLSLPMCLFFALLSLVRLSQLRWHKYINLGHSFILLSDAHIYRTHFIPAQYFY